MQRNAAEGADDELMKKRIIFGVINLLLLFVAVICSVKTTINNERINSVSTEFGYTEENGIIFLALTSGKTSRIRFGKTAVSVYDCYLYGGSDMTEILLFVRKYGEERGITLARKNTELLGEFAIHKAAYNLGYKRGQTGKLDWDYGKDKRGWVNVLSKVIGCSGLY